MVHKGLLPLIDAASMKYHLFPTNWLTQALNTQHVRFVSAMQTLSIGGEKLSTLSG